MTFVQVFIYNSLSQKKNLHYLMYIVVKIFLNICIKDSAVGLLASK